MHIVYISREFGFSLRGGGIASYINEISSGLAKLGHNVTVICASDDTRQEESSFMNGIKIIRLSNGDFVLPLIENMDYLIRFVKICKLFI